MFDDGRLRIAVPQMRLVAQRLGEIGGGIGMAAGGIGQTDADGGVPVGQQWRLDAVEHSIFVLQGSSGYLHLLTVGSERRLDDAVVEFQFLADVGQRLECDVVSVGILQLQADDAKVQPMGIDSEIFGGLLVTTVFCFLVFHSVDLGMSVA